jgi:signal transduction histidine kinase/CheY-like chemotaxis protein
MRAPARVKALRRRAMRIRWEAVTARLDAAGPGSVSRMPWRVGVRTGTFQSLEVFVGGSGNAQQERPAPAGVPPEESDAVAIARRVEQDRTAALFQLTPQPVIAGAAFSVLAGLVLWPAVPQRLLAAWLAIRLVVAFLRVLDCLQFTRRPVPPEAFARRRRRFHRLLLVDCLTWSAAGLLFVVTARAPLGLTLLASLAIVATVSVFSLASDFRAASLFFGGILIPNALYLFTLGTADACVAGSALLVLEALLLAEARVLEARLTELLRLRHENAAIAGQRQRALLMAEHSSRVKTRFLANVSHEMRTPLNGIMGMAQLLVDWPGDERRAAWLQAILDSGGHLQGVIGDLLDQSRIESGHIAVRAAPLRVRDAVREVVELTRPLAVRAGLALEVREQAGLPEWIAGDAVRIKQVLHNLVGNAIKFTPAGAVVVDLGWDGRHLRFGVTDTGVGIAPDQIERIFHAFEQAAPPDGGHYNAGTGLGLTIAREIARAMGGDIVCRSLPGHGSTFEFSLPARAMAPPPAPAPQDPGVTAPGALSGLILLAEDNEINALIARTILERAGFDVETVADGQAALDRLAHTRFDAVLMDCQMPVLDGWEATTQWRAHERQHGLARVAIVALTANSSDGDRERCLAAGMDDYLSKPFERHALVAMIRRHAMPEAAR